MARIGHCGVRGPKTDAYRAFVTGWSTPDDRSVPGSLSVHVLGRQDFDVIQIMTLTSWASLCATRDLACKQVDVTGFYPESEDLLLELNQREQHRRIAGNAP